MLDSSATQASTLLYKQKSFTASVVHVSRLFGLNAITCRY